MQLQELWWDEMCWSFIIKTKNNNKHEYDKWHSQEAIKFDELQDEQIYTSHIIQNDNFIIIQSREI